MTNPPDQPAVPCASKPGKTLPLSFSPALAIVVPQPSTRWGNASKETWWTGPRNEGDVRDSNNCNLWLIRVLICQRYVKPNAEHLRSQYQVDTYLSHLWGFLQEIPCPGLYSKRHRSPPVWWSICNVTKANPLHDTQLSQPPKDFLCPARIGVLAFKNFIRRTNVI